MIIAAIALRDGGNCYLCHQPEDADDPFEIEHVKPVRFGGTDHVSNLRLAHRSCNRHKGTHAVIEDAS
jgi:RNA-directed DNA polymerase